MAGLRGTDSKFFHDRRAFLVTVAVAFGWQVILLALSSRLTPGLIAFWAWLPLILAPIWAVRMSGRLLQRAIDGRGSDSDGFRGNLRKACAEIAGNLSAIVFQVVVFTALVSIGALLVFRMTLGMAGLVDILPIPSVEWFLGFFARFYILGFIITLLLAAIAHLAYLFGRLVERYQWLMSAWVFVLVLWIGLRAVPLVGDWLSWLPPMHFEELYIVGGVYEFRTFLVGSGPLAAVILFGLGVVFGTAAVLSRVPMDEASSIEAPSTGGV